MLVKSPLKLCRLALVLAKRAFPDYSSRNSKHDFTQPQLVACLVMKAFYRADYRKIVAILADSPSLVKEMGLKHIPHYTTLQKASERFFNVDKANEFLDKIVEEAESKKLISSKIKVAALDGTGFETRHASRYYVNRQRHTSGGVEPVTYSTYPTAGMVCDCKSHIVISLVCGEGPFPDISHAKRAITQASKRCDISTLLADGGYDAEWLHELAHTKLGIRTVIIPAPPKGPKTRKLPKGKYRKQMRQDFPKKKYGQRWQIESVNSAIKRVLGSELSAKKAINRHREIRLKVATYDLMAIRPA